MSLHKTNREDWAYNDVLTAAGLAYGAHRAHYYGNSNTPFCIHLADVVQEIMTLVDEYDEDPVIALQMMATGYLHDLLEDTDIDQEELKGLGFLPQTINAIILCTDGEGETRAEKKQEMYDRYESDEIAEVSKYIGASVKLADRICNIRWSTNTKNWKMLRKYLEESRDFEESLIFTHANGVFVDKYYEVLKDGALLYSQG